MDEYVELKKENERLNNKIKEQNLLLIEFQDMEQKVDIYKSRCEKAIEYIKSNPNVFYDENLIDVETLLENEMIDEYVGEIKFISTLLNILNGSDEK